MNLVLFLVLVLVLDRSGVQSTKFDLGEFSARRAAGDCRPYPRCVSAFAFLRRFGHFWLESFELGESHSAFAFRCRQPMDCGGGGGRDATRPRGDLRLE